MKRTFATVILVVVCCLLVSTTASAQKLLIVSDDCPPVTELTATGQFTTIDTFDTSAGTPTLSLLSQYDMVLSFQDDIPNDATALGNVLAQYVDAGGGVVVATYDMSSPWGLAGQIMTNGYTPLHNSGTNGNVSGNFVAVVPSDPIFTGVTTASMSFFHNVNFAQPTLDAGATLLATDGAGVDMAARNNSKKIVALNLFPNCSYNNAETTKLIANALTSVAGNVIKVPTLSGWALLALAAFLGVAGVLAVRG